VPFLRTLTTVSLHLMQLRSGLVTPPEQRYRYFADILLYQLYHLYQNMSLSFTSQTSRRKQMNARFADHVKSTPQNPVHHGQISQIPDGIYQENAEGMTGL